jgi:serine/threonine protein kinase
MSLEGIQLGRYQLYQMLGSGGMGEVYLAEDSGIGRQVAIKVVRSEPYYSFDLEQATRTMQQFEREMKVISQLDHPYILPLYDYGETRVNKTTITYMVMPYRPEGSFSAWLHQRRYNGPLPLQDITRFIGQAASALQHAHEHQIIHQDVKPSNFLMRVRQEEPDRPELLLMDFGISRISTSTASTSQFIEGTPTYMAPEQWQGHPTYASDQYALAVMAYELLTGHAPFSGRAELVMYKHINEMPIAPGRINPALPSAIDAVLLRALAKQPEERFPSIAAFASALQQACAGEEATIIRTRSGVQVESSSQRISAPSAAEQTVARQSHGVSGQRVRTGEYGELQYNQLATPQPAAYTPISLFAAQTEQGVATPQASQPAAEMMAGMIEPERSSSISMPYATGIPATPGAIPFQSSRSLAMPKALRIGLIIMLIWAIGGLFCYFAFARTASHTATYDGASRTSAQTSNTIATAQAKRTRMRLINRHPTATHIPTRQTTTQTSMPASAQPGVNVQATAQAQASAAVIAMAAPMYRLFSVTSGDHFYTMSAIERNNAVAAYGYRYEGIAYYAFSSQVATSVPLYRLFSTTSGHHFYTISAAERDHAVTAYSYRYEGIAGYVFNSQITSSVPLYRLYNAKNNDHFYTTSAAESKRATALGYTYEMVACYVLTS